MSLQASFLTSVIPIPKVYSSKYSLFCYVIHVEYLLLSVCWITYAWEGIFPSDMNEYLSEH